MKKSTIITVVAFALGLAVLAGGFVLFTENNISDKLFATTTTTTTTTAPADTYEPIDYSQVDVKQYIQLGQYKDITVEVESLSASDELINEQIDMMLISNGEIEEVTSGAINEGTIFSFDFTGYLDGVAFEGGAGTDTLAYIENNVLYIVSGSTFIDGFAQGMLGANVGDELSLDIKFPDNYGNAELAGKSTVFEVKINYIAKAANLTDDLINEMTDGAYKTAAEFRAYAKEYFDASIVSYNQSIAWDQVLSNSVFTIDPAEKKYYYDSIYDEITIYAQMYSMTASDFLGMGGASYVLGIEIYSLAELDEYVDSYIKEMILMAAIIAEESLEVTEDEFNTFVDSVIESTGGTREELIEQYGEEYIKKVILDNEAQELIFDSVKYVLTTDK